MFGHLAHSHHRGEIGEITRLTGTARAMLEATARRYGPAGAYSALDPPVSGVAAATRTLPRDIASFTGRRRSCSNSLRRWQGHRNRRDGEHSRYWRDGEGWKDGFRRARRPRLASWFPDGQIFLSMHGHTGSAPAGPAGSVRQPAADPGGGPSWPPLRHGVNHVVSGSLRQQLQA